MLLEPRLQLPVAREVNPDLEVPAPEPDRVAGVLDRVPPGVPDVPALLGEKRVLAVGGEQHEESSVTEVLDVRPAGLLPPGTRPLRDIDPVPGDQLLVYRLRRADGEYRRAIDAGRPRFSPSGEYLGLVGLVLDVTLWKRAEDALRVSEERFAFVRKTSGVGFWYCDLPFDVLEWDEQVKAHFHLPPDAVVSIDTFYDRLHPDDREPTRRAIERSIAEKAPYDVDYRTVDTATGAEKWVRAVGRTSYAADGTPIRFDGVTFDITERKRAADELREQDRRKDEFLATLAHELRNPLAPVRTGLQILKMTPPGRSAEKAHDMMDRQLGHMVRLIDDLLDVSRISRGKVDLRRERVDLRTVVENAVETSHPVVEAGRHDLAVNLPDEPVWLDADLTRLAQVVSNVITNAAKYTPEGGRIHLAARRDGDEAVVTVTDTGVGIPAKMLAGVFEMFSQVNKTLDRAQGGLGIGLALVRRLAEMHGGSITAESAGTGRGSTFTVRLPIAVAQELHPPPGRNGAAHATPASFRVLVVDDNKDGAESLAMLLKLSGHDARVAHDG
ncbi:MAG: hypothetical protein C0501_25725 [Isosphaera sp.]|nr:hypothetical protein [Isosphaera sp.]